MHGFLMILQHTRTFVNAVAVLALIRFYFRVERSHVIVPEVLYCEGLFALAHREVTIELFCRVVFFKKIRALPGLFLIFTFVF